MARVYNWKREPVDDRDIKSTRYLTKAAEKLPAKFQLEFDIPIYDQEDLGSCTANSGCSCYRYESAQILKNFGFDPSRLFLYYNTRLIEDTVEYDSGAYIRDTFKAMNKYGLAPEADFPYITNTFTKKPTSTAYTNALKNIIVKYAKVDQDETVIKKTLQSGASVSFGFNVYQSFEAGNWQTTTGIMPIPKPGERLLGGHAVTIIGWDDSKNSFLIQNSWGIGWGLKGKFWMPYSFLLDWKECDDFWSIEEIRSDTTDPTAKLELKELLLTIFKSKKELNKNTEDVIVRIGILLNLPVDLKLTKANNVKIVATYLELK